MSELFIAKMEAIEKNQQKILRQLDGAIDPVFMDVHKAAETYGLTGQTFRMAIKKGILKGYKFGKKVYVKRKEVIQKIESGLVETTYVRA